MVELRVVGVAPGADTYDTTVKLNDIPRVGDSLEVWNGDYAIYVKIDMITWPTWTFDHDEADVGLPDVYLVRPEDISDEEWADVFAAIKERRSP